MINIYLYTFLILHNTLGYFCIDQSILKELSGNDLDDYLNSELSADCPTSNNDTLVIKGYNVKFSDFVRSDGKLYNLCSNHSTINILKVYVLKSLFIDMDLDVVGDEIQLTVIAPDWKVLGKRSITLSGLDGKIHDPPTAKSGVKGDQNGANGLSGNPGGPGGNYVGIGHSFFNGKNLNISTRGGNGGIGQNGGDGKDMIMRHATYKRNFDYKDCLHFGRTCFHVGIHFLRDNYTESSCFTCSSQILSYIWSIALFRIDFEQCLDRKDYAGLPGDGGSGGKGGLSGTLWSFELSNSSFISLSKHPGKYGSGGKGGLGGKNSGATYRLIIDCSYLYTHHKFENFPFFGLKEPQIKGYDGTSTFGIKDPKKTEMTEITWFEDLNKYKTFVRESLSSDPARTNSLVQFYELIDNNDMVQQRLYNNFGLIAELRSIEDHFHVLNKEVDFTPFYASLLNRIANYVDRQEIFFKEGYKQEKKMLAYAYSSILGKLFFLKESSQSVLVTDIGSYLRLTSYKFEHLSSIEHMVQSLNNIKQLKDDYNELVLKKVKEAYDVIQQDIMPNFQNKIDMANPQLDSLLNQIKQFNKSLLDDQEKINTFLARNTEIFALKTVLNVASFATLGASILTAPMALIVGGLGLGLLTTAKVALDNYKIEAPNVTNLPTIVEQLDGNLAHFLSKETDRLIKRLDHVLRFANKYPQSLNDLSQKIVDIKQRVGQSNSLCEVKALERESVNVVKKQYEEIKEYSVFLLQVDRQITDMKVKPKPKPKPADKGSKDKEDEADVVAWLFDGIGSFGADMAGDVLEYLDNVELAKLLLSSLTRKLKKLKQYEDMVYNLLCPLFDNLTRTIVDVSNNLENLSQVLLLVVNYKIKATLESIIVFVSKFTQEFEARDIYDYLTNIKGDFGLLVGVYSQLQNYMDELNLANHMADLTSTAANDINMTSYYLKGVDELSITISSNLVLMYYQSAISAFRQFVFPFAHDYFQELILPKHLEVGKNLTDFVQKAHYQILHLMHKLDLYKSTVGNSIEWTHSSFNSFRNSTRPFFTWKNEQHREMISKLLSGEEVVAFADIEKSVSAKDAIKFSEVAIYFKTANQTEQDNINKCLETRKITLVHQGNSYFRYNSKFYLLTSTSLSISFSFDHENGEPVVQSETYKKIKQGDYMLSPYTSWKLKISNIHEDTSFDDLKVYENVTDVELGGKGKYIDNKIENKKDLMEDMYYKPLGI